MTREEAIKMLKLLEYAEESPMYDALNMAIEALSHERPKGRWYTAEAHNGYLYWNCNQCHGHFTSQKTNYCPNCGADMRGEEE